MESKFLTESQILKMNNSYPWNGTISIVLKSSKNVYVLYATGVCDIRGRQYIALPSDIKVNDYIKRKHNTI
tara:strand:- start:110 stop:322 length:213 start_codon:yes stop_codon:yes gene_type:complete